MAQVSNRLRSARAHPRLRSGNLAEQSLARFRWRRSQTDSGRPEPIPGCGLETLPNKARPVSDGAGLKPTPVGPGPFPAAVWRPCRTKPGPFPMGEGPQNHLRVVADRAHARRIPHHQGTKPPRKQTLRAFVPWWSVFLPCPTGPSLVPARLGQRPSANTTPSGQRSSENRSHTAWERTMWVRWRWR
jgi:hypothetical protein